MKKKLKIKVTKNGYDVENKGYTPVEIIGILEIIKRQCILESEVEDNIESIINNN